MCQVRMNSSHLALFINTLVNGDAERHIGNQVIKKIQKIFCFSGMQAKQFQTHLES